MSERLTREEYEALWACIHCDSYGPYATKENTPLIVGLSPWEVGDIRDSAMRKLDAMTSGPPPSEPSR